jgi:hypothetical protein
MQTIKISVAGVILEFTLENTLFYKVLLENYEDFLTRKDPDYRFTVNAYTMDIREDYTDPVTALSGRMVTVGRRDFKAKLDLDQRQGTLEINDNIYAFDSFHRVLYSMLMLAYDGLLLHCCGLIKDGLGYIFLGLSESGKSTMYRITPESVLLSDEMVVVRRREGKFHVCGTPFWGDFRKGTKNRHVPVHGLYFLHQAGKNFTRPISEKEAVMRVMRNALFFSRAPTESARLFMLCSAFVSGVPSRELHFLPDPSVWDVIDG